MPRRSLIRSDHFPYHITSRSNNREWFYIPINDVWRYALELLDEGRKSFSIQVEAFVLMDNHYHLCIFTPQANIDQFMRFFNKGLGSKIAKQSGRINRTFGAPYKWTLITSERYFSNVLRYVYQNPLRAGLCNKCEEYPFSDLTLKSQEISFLDYINTLQCKFDVDKTRKNLRKYEI